MSNNKKQRFERYIDKSSIPGHEEKSSSGKTKFNVNQAKIDDVKTALENDTNAPSWLKGGAYTEEDNPHGLADRSDFIILFPQYREQYLKENISQIESTLAASPYYLKVTLNCKEGKMIVETTDKTFDPFIIFKGRDCLQLVARGVPFPQAKKVLQDDVFSEVIKIGNLCRNKEVFTKRRQRLFGPDGSTLKALEILTGCFIFIQGKTVSVIGEVNGIKTVSEVISDCMNNIHPIYHIKQLMVKRELKNNSEYANVPWDKYLPKFKKSVNKSIVKKKNKKLKPKKEYTPFPPAPEKSKKDIAIETGEYFLSEQEKQRKREVERLEQQQEKKIEKKKENDKLYQPPKEEENPKKRKVDSVIETDDNLIKNISQRQTSGLIAQQKKKTKASDFIDN
ncbi:hypothetical protein C9374_008399 [Naegleria lovaniensis]|uniref:KRR-R motif-containing protein 1 n=1 Tax=Naegleria lovaniensis TaxID=51637 RepID=A0AA88GJD4_NAELO|nr:uncharacterized protein C9374_008399 [Naegleria lovaniensis]KAG2378256.1 hypothetical protein C9374_008399 [Naegleria lovaniensis]